MLKSPTRTRLGSKQDSMTHAPTSPARPLLARMMGNLMQVCIIFISQETHLYKGSPFNLPLWGMTLTLTRKGCNHRNWEVGEICFLGFLTNLVYNDLHLRCQKLLSEFKTTPPPPTRTSAHSKTQVILVKNRWIPLVSVWFDNHTPTKQGVSVCNMDYKRPSKNNPIAGLHTMRVLVKPVWLNMINTNPLVLVHQFDLFEKHTEAGLNRLDPPQ